MSNCRPYLVEEIALMSRLRVVVALGRVAFETVISALKASGRIDPAARPRFAHGAECRFDNGLAVVASYHPSQQNTFTGKLTEGMLDRVFKRARTLARDGESRRARGGANG
jgi:uracil-DNA glycosylase